MASEGSKPQIADSIKKTFNGSSTLSEHAPSTTPYPYERNMDDKIVESASAEVIRRKNNRVRDNRKRWAVVNDPMGTSDRKSPA